MNCLINRRGLLLMGCGVAAGATVPSLIHWQGNSWEDATWAAENDAPQAEQRLRDLGIELPPAPNPVAVYVPAVVTGNLLFASGHGPRKLDGKSIQGKVGADLSLQQGYQAARTVGLNVLSTVRNTLGTLDRVVRLVKVLGMVNCTPDFTKQPQVINGFSELMVQVFGPEHGKGARSAVGMGSLPSNIAVEIEAIFEVRV